MVHLDQMDFFWWENPKHSGRAHICKSIKGIITSFKWSLKLSVYNTLTYAMHSKDLCCKVVICSTPICAISTLLLLLSYVSRHAFWQSQQSMPKNVVLKEYIPFQVYVALQRCTPTEPELHWICLASKVLPQQWDLNQTCYSTFFYLDILLLCVVVLTSATSYHLMIPAFVSHSMKRI